MKGYSKIAALIGKYPESAIFSQFSALNAQSLLYRQAELIGLRQDLHELEEANETSSDPEQAAFSQDWHALSSANGGSHEQWKLVLLIRDRLKEYNKALLQYSQLCKLGPPNPRDLYNLQEWMARPSMGAVFLLGRDRHIWAQGRDLVACAARPSGNKFSGWLIDYLTPVYHSTIGRYHKKPDVETAEYAPNVVNYANSTILSIAGFVGTIVASLLPVCAIVVLYLVTGVATRLGLVGAFTATFAVCLWFMTDGRLVEVFSATSAFAAVQVVFVSTNITST